VFNAWFEVLFQVTQLGLEAQNVIALRLMRLAGGGPAGIAEAQLIIGDKMAAVTEAQLAAAATMLAGDSHKVAAKVLRVFNKRVRANRTRLSRRRR
jgi:hypothetical protein